MLNKTIYIDLKSYWHAGSGRSAGTFVDAIVHKNADGLPLIGGRHIKGLLRHAFAKAEAMGWFKNITLPEGPTSSLEALLFGSMSQQEGRYTTLPGMLFVSDACLPDGEANWLSKPEQAMLKQYLYTHLSSTAINENGSAKEDSLRTIEVTLPMTLEASLQLSAVAVDETHRAQQEAWLQQNDPWLPLIEASAMIESVGASRSRGLGEALITWNRSEGTK